MKFSRIFHYGLFSCYHGCHSNSLGCVYDKGTRQELENKQVFDIPRNLFKKTKFTILTV